MKSKVSGIYSLILVLVAFSSLVSMFSLTRIDSMIRQDLYRYGLRFSYEWALPYWTLSSLVFVMGWVNIILACAFQFYVFLYGRKREEVKVQCTFFLSGDTHKSPAGCGVDSFVDVLDVSRLAAQTTAVVDDLVVYLSCCKVD